MRTNPTLIGISNSCYLLTAVLLASCSTEYASDNNTSHAYYPHKEIIRHLSVNNIIDVSLKGIAKDDSGNILLIASQKNTADGANKKYGKIYLADKNNEFKEIFVGSTDNNIFNPIDLIYNKYSHSFFMCTRSNLPITQVPSGSGGVALGNNALLNVVGDPVDPKISKIIEFRINDIEIKIIKTWRIPQETSKNDDCFRLAVDSSGYIYSSNTRLNASTKSSSYAVYKIDPISPKEEPIKYLQYNAIDSSKFTSGTEAGITAIACSDTDLYMSYSKSTEDTHIYKYNIKTKKVIDYTILESYVPATKIKEFPISLKYLYGGDGALALFSSSEYSIEPTTGGSCSIDLLIRSTASDEQFIARNIVQIGKISSTKLCYNYSLMNNIGYPILQNKDGGSTIDIYGWNLL